MRHIVQNSVISVSADSENPSFPATVLLDLHPKRKFRAATGVGTATVTADVSGGCSDILVAGTNVATASIVAVDPNTARWASDSWGMSPPSYSTPVAHFASGEELDISGTVTQRSKSESLWIQLSEPVFKPCILSITLSSGTATLEAGVLSAGLAETYGTANPNYGLSSTMIDYSIEEENSNGSYYYKKRDIVRSFDGTATMTRDSAFTMLDSYELIGKNPSGWKLTDMDGNEWVVFGKFGASPEVSHDYPSHSNVSFSIIEVF